MRVQEKLKVMEREERRGVSKKKVGRERMGFGQKR